MLSLRLASPVNPSPLKNNAIASGTPSDVPDDQTYQQAARKNALQHLTDKLFKGSAELLFSHLVSDQKLSEEQIKRMRQLLAVQSDKEKP